MKAIITLSDINALARTCHADESIAASLIAEAERQDIKPKIGDALYLQITRDEVPAAFDTLLNGGEWQQRCGTIRYLTGLRTALAYYAYARIIRDGNIQSTRFGAVIKTEDNSAESERAERQRQYREAFTTADGYMSEVMEYLSENAEAFGYARKTMRANRCTLRVIDGTGSSRMRDRNDTPIVIDGAVGTTKLAARSVTTDKIKEGAVTSTELADDVTSAIDNGLNAQSLTHSALKALRDAKKLVPGRVYRITDFVTTTTLEDTKSAGHAFDILVVADDEGTLNENAHAILHEGDTYFAECSLNAWRLKYCFDNDAERFAWADTVNGKGVIYRMIDEWENDVPYDFKNIMFKRYKVTGVTTASSRFKDGYYGIEGGYTGVVVSTTDFIWVYTFDAKDVAQDTGKIIWDGTPMDASVNQGASNDPNGGGYIHPILHCEHNSLKAISTAEQVDDETTTIKQTLNDGVFYSVYKWFTEKGENRHELEHCAFNHFEDSHGFTIEVGSANKTGKSCYNFLSGHDSSSWTCGDGCFSWTCGNQCFEWTCGNECHDWICKNLCYSWHCGNVCSFWICWDECYTWTCGNGCSSWHCEGYSDSWTCGNNCDSWHCGSGGYSWSCGNGCTEWTCGDGCYSWSCGDECEGWTCDNDCYSWSCGNNCSDWTCGYQCFSWTCGNGCLSWTCGDYSSNWVCGNWCTDWTCGSNCSYWTCGNGCYSWSCGDECEGWTCGNGCHSWTCGNSCYYWSCGNFCDSWTCGSSYNAPADNMSHFQIEDGTRFFHIKTDGPFTGTLQNFIIKRGVNTGLRAEALDIVIPVQVFKPNSNYTWTIARNSKGELKQYCEADLIN